MFLQCRAASLSMAVTVDCKVFKWQKVFAISIFAITGEIPSALEQQEQHQHYLQ